MTLKKLLQHIKENPHVAVSIVAFICFCQFVTSVFHIFRNGEDDIMTMNQLLSSADGLEAVILFLITLALNNKKK
jgi:hypothetical protein